MSPSNALRAACGLGLALAATVAAALADEKPPRPAAATTDRLTFADPPADITRAADLKTSDGTPAGESEITLAVALSPDGKFLARAGEPPAIELRRRDGNRRVALLSAHTEPVTALAFPPDGTHLASGGFDRVVRIWDVPSGRETLAISTHDGWIRALAYAPDGNLLATATQDGHVRLRDASTGRTLADLRGHEGAVRSLAWSPDGTRLATAGADRNVIVWDVARRSEMARWPGHVGTVRALAWSPDGKTLASAGEDHLILLRDATDGRVLYRVAATADQVLSLAFTPRGTGLLAGCYDGKVRIVETNTGKLADTLAAHAEAVVALAIDRTSGHLVSAGLDQKLREWTPAAPMARLVATLETTSGSFARALFTTDHREFILYESFGPAGRPRSLRFHDPSSGNLLRSVELPFSTTFMDVRGGGRRALLRTPDGQVSVWDVASRSEVFRHNGSSSGRSGGASVLSPDGMTLAAAQPDGSLLVWKDGPSPQRSTLALPSTEQRPPSVQELQFSPSGDRVLGTLFFADPGGSGRQRHAIWDLRSGRSLWIDEATRTSNTQPIWSPDGARIAVFVASPTPGLAPRLEYFDPVSGAPKGGFELTGTTPTGLMAWHPDGRRLALVTTSGSLVFWDLQTQERLGSIRVADRSFGPVVFDREGRRLATADRNVVKIWDLSREPDSNPQPTHGEPQR